MRRLRDVASRRALERAGIRADRSPRARRRLRDVRPTARDARGSLEGSTLRRTRALRCGISSDGFYGQWRLRGKRAKKSVDGVAERALDRLPLRHGPASAVLGGRRLDIEHDRQVRQARRPESRRASGRRRTANACGSSRWTSIAIRYITSPGFRQSHSPSTSGWCGHMYVAVMCGALVARARRRSAHGPRCSRRRSAARARCLTGSSRRSPARSASFSRRIAAAAPGKSSTSFGSRM